MTSDEMDSGPMHVEGTVSLHGTQEPAKVNRALIGVLVSCLALSLASFFGGVAYSDYRASTSARQAAAKAVVIARANTEKSEQALCALVGSLDGAYRAQPPTTPTGKLVARQMHDLLTLPPPKGLGCPEK